MILLLLQKVQLNSTPSYLGCLRDFEKKNAIDVMLQDI